MTDRRRTIAVDRLARVEGEGGIYVKVQQGKVSDVRLHLFEPPRLFEGFLRGRQHTEAPDLTARICGICPVAYQMSSVQAVEDALGLTVDGPLRELRRLLYCGEWIQSHALHIFLLHAPDFLGYDDAIRMAGDHPELVTRGLAIKKLGNEIISIVGGREIHPVNVRVGGFHRVPARAELAPLADTLERTRDAARETVRWTATLDAPDFERDHELVALRHATEYPLNEGRVTSSRGLDIPIEEFEAHFVEQHLEHSNALHSVRRGHGAYVVGPLARYSLNFDRLTPLAQESAAAAGLGPVCRNPFKGIVVRAVELLYACEEALRIVRAYQPPDRAFVAADPGASTGYGCTEAPRGLLYHRYALDGEGRILEAKIVPPTAQNQKSVEMDLRQFVEQHLDLPVAELTWKCEQAVRNYDPCISCATHLVTIEMG